MNRKLETKLRKYAQEACREEYGFAPALRDIHIYGYHMNHDLTCQWTQFAIGCHIYNYDGITLEKRDKCDIYGFKE